MMVVVVVVVVEDTVVVSVVVVVVVIVSVETAVVDGVAVVVVRVVVEVADVVVVNAHKLSKVVVVQGATWVVVEVVVKLDINVEEVVVLVSSIFSILLVDSGVPGLHSPPAISVCGFRSVSMPVWQSNMHYAGYLVHRPHGG